jgi:hypothetical protein
MLGLRWVTVSILVVACHASESSSAPAPSTTTAPAASGSGLGELHLGSGGPAPGNGVGLWALGADGGIRGCTELFARCVTPDGKPGTCAEAMPTSGPARLVCLP